MSLFAKLFKSRPPRTAGRARPKSLAYQPNVEPLEARDCPTLAAPNPVSLSILSPTQVNVTWTDVADETGYRVLHWTGTDIVTVDTVAADVTTYTVKGLSPAHKEWLTVEAFNAAESIKATWEAVTMPPDPITAPTQYSAHAITTTRIDLTWKDGLGETAYDIYQWNGTIPVKVQTLAANTTHASITGLKPATVYYFYVEARNPTNAVDTAWATARTRAEPITAPTNLKGKAVSTTQIDLTWTDATGETGYRVYRWNGKQPVLVATLAANVTRYSVKNLSAGASYWFYVQAFNKSNAANTAWLSVTTLAAHPLTAPTALTARVASITSIRLAWGAASSAVGYGVYQWTGLAWKRVATVGPTVRAITLTGFAHGHTYWFVVQAFTKNNLQTANSPTAFVNF
jgi:Fibronectin type III domain